MHVDFESHKTCLRVKCGKIHLIKSRFNLFYELEGDFVRMFTDQNEIRVLFICFLSVVKVLFCICHKMI